jgi:MerR family Zn(II)-responsive transcriptional regulator of zntA
MHADTIDEMELIQISELARRAGVTTATIRHYERRGLLAPTNRGPGGSRLYDPQSVDQLMLIRRIRATGLSLKESSDLLEVLASSDIAPSSPEALGLLERRLRSVRAHLEHVQRVERTLVDALDIGRANGRPDDPASVVAANAQSGPDG